MTRPSLPEMINNNISLAVNVIMTSVLSAKLLSVSKCATYAVAEEQFYTVAFSFLCLQLWCDTYRKLIVGCTPLGQP